MSNPNSFSVYFPEIWAKTAQVLHKPKAIYRQIANFRAESELKKGDTFKRIRPNSAFISAYSRNTDIPGQAGTGQDENLVVDNQFAFRYQIDEFDEIQSSVNLVETYGGNAAKDLANAIDSEVLFNTLSATSTIDDATLGGSADTPLTLTGSNVIEAFTTVHEKLAEQNIELSDLYGVIDPATMQTLLAYASARETKFGDYMLERGLEGDMYSGRLITAFGIPMFVTNNYTRRVVLSLATNPTNGDTVTFTVGGTAIVFTFVSSIGSTPGNVLIGASADATRANLAGLINAPTTTSSTQVGWPADGVLANEEILSRLQVSSSATNDNTANTLTFFSKGQTVSGSDTLTDATDGFVSAQASKELMFARRGNIDVVIQSQPKMLLRPEPRNLAMNIMGTSLFGTKLYTDGAEQTVRMRVAA